MEKDFHIRQKHVFLSNSGTEYGATSVLKNSGTEYGANSVKRFTEFLTRCQHQLQSKSNVFWVSLQSNLLADVSVVTNDFADAVQEMKVEMKGNGWILPTLSANMRNQVNIAKVDFEKGDMSGWEMQFSIEKLASGSSLIGEIPMLFQVKLIDWEEKKDKMLKHCIDLMSKKSEQNMAVLWDHDQFFDGVAVDIKTVVKDKRVVSYPSKQSKKEGIRRKKKHAKKIIKQFVEKSGYILVTKNKYFNGCECANVIVLTYGDGGVRNSVLRGVQNMLCIQLTIGNEAKMNGMKEDDRFLSDSESESDN